MERGAVPRMAGQPLWLRCVRSDSLVALAVTLTLALTLLAQQLL